MTRIRRGGYVFVTWIGDHEPRHVHVQRDGKTVVKWDLERGEPMEGRPSRRIIELIHLLSLEGRI